MGYLGEEAVRFFGKRTKRYYANQIIAAGTIITNGYQITLPLNYVVGNNSLELFWDGCKLIKSDGVNDGHYQEYGLAGNTTNKVTIYRTVSDGSCKLIKDAVLETYVKGVDQE